MAGRGFFFSSWRVVAARGHGGHPALDAGPREVVVWRCARVASDGAGSIRACLGREGGGLCWCGRLFLVAGVADPRLMSPDPVLGRRGVVVRRE